jgi:hypothetical protein
MNTRLHWLKEQASEWVPTPSELGADFEYRIDEDKFAKLLIDEIKMMITGAQIRGESYDDLLDRLHEEFGKG